MNGPSLTPNRLMTGLRIFAVYAAGFTLTSAASSAEWQPQPIKGGLTTPWTSLVSPANALPEYPRPQMVRPQWINLNGLWDYEVKTTDAITASTGRILVPFAIESALSGVGQSLLPGQQLIYTRRFARPALKPGERVWLHFGAVDWHATVILNNQPIGEHRGGYDPFSFDITDGLTAGDQNLTVIVTDPSDSGYQPAGKQSLKPSNDSYYTPVSGIWQTVWMETVPTAHIRSVRAEARKSLDGFSVEVAANGAGPETTVTVQVHDAEALIGEATARLGEVLSVAVPSPKLWHPGSPHLYDLTVSLSSGDVVRSYAALRTIELRRDEQGRPKLALNGQIGFQLGPLDQGYWPDGLYTAPTDEALRFDIAAMKGMGFNVVRKHVKVEPARWYYWCDKLGLMVWQDIPSARALDGEEGRGSFDREAKAIIESLRTFPSIVMWVLFNEGWGQSRYGVPRSRELAEWLMAHDPTRLVNTASGWTDTGNGHVRDLHLYPTPDMPPVDGLRAPVVGEFGGLRLAVRDNLWRPRTDAEAPHDNPKLQTEYARLMAAVRLAQGQGLAAAIYTQLTDIEDEINGYLTYDRRLNKYSSEWLSSAHRAAFIRAPLVDTLAGGTELWSVAAACASKEWMLAAFDDSSWNRSRGPFGANYRGAHTLGAWEGPALLLRKTFRMPAGFGESHLVVRTVRGAQVRVAINGVVLIDGPSQGVLQLPLKEKSVLKADGGLNVVTVEASRADSSPQASFDVRVIATRGEKAAALESLASPILFRGDATTAFRDPTAVYHDGWFRLFFTLVKMESDGKVFSYVAWSKSRDLRHWSAPVVFTPRDQGLNFGSPGNVVRQGGDWVLCLQTYPRPNGEAYGNETARLWTMRSRDLETWSAPELLRVKGPDVPQEKMGRMIDPFLLESRTEPGKWWCFYKQNGVSRSWSRDLQTWTFAGRTAGGENACVLVDGTEYVLFHSPRNGIGVKRSNDLEHWRDEGVLTLGQTEWPWAQGRLTAGFVLDLRQEPGWGKALMFFHGSDFPEKDPRGGFDNYASIGVAWSEDLRTWQWPGQSAYKLK